MLSLVNQMFELLHNTDEPLRRIVIMYMMFYIINKTLPRYRLSSRVAVYTVMMNKITQLRNDYSVDFGEFTIFGNPNLPTIETILESRVEYFFYGNKILLSYNYTYE